MKYLLSAGIVFSEQIQYVHEIESGNRMILEFEAEIEGKYVNGADIIDFNDDGLITEFKVMVRPLQAVNMLWQQMGAPGNARLIVANGEFGVSEPLVEAKQLNVRRQGGLCWIMYR